MQRRTFLASVGAGMPLATAGCLGVSAPGGGASASPRTTTGDRRTTSDSSGEGTTTDELGGEESTTDGNGSRPADGVTPPAAPSALATEVSGLECPAVGERADLRVCSTTTDPDEVPVVLSPERPTFDPAADGDEATLRITLSNRSDGEFGFNPYAWSLHRREGDRWRRVGPDAYPEPWRTLDPGATYSYELTGDTGSTPDGPATISRAFEPGIYAMAVDGQLQGGDGGRRWIECVALFGVERDE